MIKLLDLISLGGVELQDFKIHFAVPTGEAPTPYEAFLSGEFKEWQEVQGRRNFPCEHVLSLIQMPFSSDRWLFAGVYAVHSFEPLLQDERTRYKYETTEVQGLSHLVGRAIVDFPKKFRQSYPYGSSYKNRLIVAELRRDRQTIVDFPGYDSVRISMMILRAIVNQKVPSWVTALSNVGGVYIIVDTRTGGQYVGSAYGGNGIWQRWVQYADTGHGQNKKLKEILEESGPKGAESFQFSILEVCDLKANEDYVIQREAFWKNVLRTRDSGLNAN